MKTIKYIEVPVRYQTVRLRRLNPFHWALLRTLQVFGPGARPDLDELTKRLCIGEPVFLNEAWRELLTWHAVDDAVFSQARLTMEGETALQEGLIPFGTAEEKTRPIYFTSEGEPLSPAKRGDVQTAKPLSVPPPWSSNVTASQIEQFLLTQAGTRSPDERWQSIRLAWENARTVTFAASALPKPTESA
ncbi:MAG: hypothetical protein IPP19_07100 [Verrucomicrobia bacterium]|nr:hypothetical protein [Verrucomicrobiota bacterium]